MEMSSSRAYSNVQEQESEGTLDEVRQADRTWRGVRFSIETIKLVYLLFIYS